LDSINKEYPDKFLFAPGPSGSQLTDYPNMRLEYGNPVLENPQQLFCQWLTGTACVRISIDKEVGGVFSEKVMSGFHYHHNAE
jgi:hypothetical protein